MNKNRTFAKISGWSLVLMSLVAGFSFGFVFPKIYNTSQIYFVQKNLIENLQLYKMMLIGITVIILIDLLVSWTLYLFFRNDNKNLALFSCISRMIYTFVFLTASYYLVKNIGQVNDSNAILIENYQSFESIWTFGLIIFGFHLLAVGGLMKQHKLVPRTLWYLVIFAGVSYILVHVLKMWPPETAKFNSNLEVILSLPMALGELGLAIWLIIKGGKIEKQKI